MRKSGAIGANIALIVVSSSSGSVISIGEKRREDER